jgi:hypothetical protein
MVSRARLNGKKIILPGSGERFIPDPDPRSQIQEVKNHRIPDPEHCCKVNITHLEICREGWIVSGIDNLQIAAIIGHISMIKGIATLHWLALELHDLVPLRHLLIELCVQIHRGYSLKIKMKVTMLNKFYKKCLM